jgi:hypothetical protein
MTVSAERVVVARPSPATAAPAGSSAAVGHDALASVATATDFRDVVAKVDDDRCVTGVLDACVRPIVYSRHHSLLYKGDYRVRADLRGYVDDIRTRGPMTWDADECDLVFSLFALATAGVGLDELRDRVDSTSVRDVLEERYDLYASVLLPDTDRPRPLLALAHRVTGMRSMVERTHHLYSIIDGKAWYRSEGAFRRSDVEDGRLTDAAERVIGLEFGVGSERPTTDRLAEATRRCIAEHGDSAPLVRALMAAALEDEVLRGDHVTLTCPMGDALDAPESMTTSEAFFTETQLRAGLSLDDYRERLGHESSEQLRRTIRARMLKLKRGAIRSLYGPGCLQGQFVEKHGGHMIFRNEDAHYRGHQSIGCSSGGRASFALRYRSAGEARELTPMVGDFRVVRMSHDPRDTFTGDELTQVIRYAEWLRLVVEETYRAGCVVRRDDVGDPARPVAVAETTTGEG